MGLVCRYDWCYCWLDHLRGSILRNKKLAEATARAEALLRKHGLNDWSVQIFGKRSVLGEAWHKQKTIKISKFFVYVANAEQFEGIVLHEVAHALLGPGFGHGEEFVATCTRISRNNRYATESSSFKIHRYRFTCPRCEFVGTSNANRDMACARCSTGLGLVKFNKEVNTLEVRSW